MKNSLIILMGMVLLFTQNGVADTGWDSFVGTWTGEIYDEYGGQDMSLTVHPEPGKITATFGELKGRWKDAKKETWTIESAKIEKGELNATSPHGSHFKFTLREDGTIKIRLSIYHSQRMFFVDGRLKQ